jgi:hypothetical protein
MQPPHAIDKACLTEIATQAEISDALAKLRALRFSYKGRDATEKSDTVRSIAQIEKNFAQ